MALLTCLSLDYIPGVTVRRIAEAKLVPSVVQILRLSFFNSMVQLGQVIPLTIITQTVKFVLYFNYTYS